MGGAAGRQRGVRGVALSGAAAAVQWTHVVVGSQVL